MSAENSIRAELRDPSERLSADDQATQREAEFLSRALQMQSARAAAMPRGVPGVCSNCLQQCLPTAVYCDDECRTDHEARERRGR